MNKINIGCGPDLKDGWKNTDNNTSGQWVDDTDLWDISKRAPVEWHGLFDFALVNHTLCLLSYDEADVALENIKEVLADGGVLQVVDMDTLKAFENMKQGKSQYFNGFTGNIEDQMCRHLVGYGRKSIYTPASMAAKLEQAGFKNVTIRNSSEYDFRPHESFAVEGTK